MTAKRELRLTDPSVIQHLSWSAQIRAHEGNLEALETMAQHCYEDMVAGEIPVELYEAITGHTESAAKTAKKDLALAKEKCPTKKQPK